MAKYEVGSFIKRLRIQKGIKQEDLAYPIIDQATLSKIENSRAMPNRKTMEALFERLGVKPNSLADFFLDKEEAEAQKLYNEIDNYLVMQTQDAEVIAKVDALIAQLEGYTKLMESSLHRQHLLALKATNAINKNAPADEVAAMLKEAIEITIPRFDENKIEDYLLSKQDMRIINLMAVLYHVNDDYEKSIVIKYGMKNNFEKHCIDKEEMGRHYTLITYNLALSLFHVHKYQEAIDVCDLGMKAAIDARALHLIPNLAAQKALCLFNIGEKEACLKLTRQAYYTSELHGADSGLLAHLRNFAKENLDAEFD